MSQKDFTRRNFLKAVSMLSLPIPFHAEIKARASARELNVYIGTYTSGRSEGIYIYRMNLSSGELKYFSTVKGVANPSFLAIDRSRRYLYAVNEVAEFAGKPGGAVSAFSIDQKTGDLRFLNQQPSLGGAPCYVVVDETGKFVLVANYRGGNITVLPVQHDGSLGVAADMVQHQGSSINTKRQQGPHAHCVVLDRSNQHAFAADLGLDKVLIYRFNAQQGKLTQSKEPWIQVKPGAGPRHFTFHPNGKYAYVINELDSTLTAFSYDQRRGTLSEMQNVSTLPKDFSGTNYCADVHVSPSGKFLYGSNRGHDSIVVFAINERTGNLTYVDHESTQGKTPRNFAVDPTGKYLLAANQNSDTIVTFRIDPAKGRLIPTGQVTEVPTPVCLKLIPSFL